LKGQYTAANWQIGASMWEAEAEAVNTANAATATNYINPRLEQSSQAVWGYIRFGGFKVGAAMNMAELTNAGVVTSDRTSYTLPVSYTTGAHNFYAHYTAAGDDDATTATTDGATMMAIAYVYDLSKRTSVGVTYAAIDNDAGGRYNFFTGTSLGSADAAVGAGEDPTLIQVTLRHAF
jgi:predicted porin